MLEERALGALTVETRPAHVYPSSPPNLFNFVTPRPGLRNWILRPLTRNDVLCPAEGFVVLDSAHVLDGKFVLDAAGFLISETAKDSDVGRIRNRLSELSDAGVEARSLVDNGRPFVHLFKEGCANYGHVLLEMLPKLLNLAGQGVRAFNVITPSEGAWAIPLFREVATIVGVELEFVQANQPLLKIDELVLCSPVSEHNRRKSETSNALVALLLDRYQAAGGQSNLYVTRGSSEKRRIVNGASLESYFRGIGYRIVDPRKLTFEEQITAFAGARRVVGALGAGLSNLVFAPENARAFMIDPGLYDFFFWDIACLRRQTFSWYFNRPLDMFDPHMLSAPFEVDEPNLRASLAMSDFI